MNLAQKYGKVAVIMGGRSTEREVSLISGKAVLASLLRLGIDAFAFDPLEEPIEKLKALGVSRAVLMIHGKTGEDGQLQGAMEYLRIPYTGSGVMASAIAMDKYRTNLIWRQLGIPVANSQYLDKNQYQPNDFKLKIKLPLVVKPADDGSTLGLTKVYKESDLHSAIDFALQTSSKILLEEMVIGSEYTIIVIDGKVYPIIKIEAPSGEYDFHNKYYSDETIYLCPYDLGEKQAEVEALALAGYNAVGACGVTRLDFMINEADDKLYFLEINTLPGMTSHSLVPQSVASVGIDFDKLCLMILDGASLDK